MKRGGRDEDMRVEGERSRKRNTKGEKESKRKKAKHTEEKNAHKEKHLSWE